MHFAGTKQISGSGSGSDLTVDGFTAGSDGGSSSLPAGSGDSSSLPAGSQQNFRMVGYGNISRACMTFMIHDNLIVTFSNNLMKFILLMHIKVLVRLHNKISSLLHMRSTYL